MYKKLIGITLIELLVALSIMGILTLIAVPSIVSIVQKHRLSATAEKLYYDLQYARSEAVKNNTTIYVSFQIGDSWCYGINSGSSCNCAVVGNCNLGSSSAAAAQQLSLSTNGFSSNLIQFEGTRGAANNSGSVTLTLYGQTTLITISIGTMGGLKMCATGINGYTAC